MVQIMNKMCKELTVEQERALSKISRSLEDVFERKIYRVFINGVQNYEDEVYSIAFCIDMKNFRAK